MTKPNTNPPRPAAHPARASQAFSPDAAGVVPSATRDALDDAEAIAFNAWWATQGMTSDSLKFAAWNGWLARCTRSETPPLTASDFRLLEESQKYGAYASACRKTPVSATPPKPIGLFWQTVGDGHWHFNEGAFKREDVHDNGRPIHVALLGEKIK